MRATELYSKEVICICDGRRLGYVSDLEIRVPDGEIMAIVVPGPGRFLGCFGRNGDYYIPWSCIKKIGPDIILADVRPEDCCHPRPKPGIPRPEGKGGV